MQVTSEKEKRERETKREKIEEKKTSRTAADPTEE